MSKYKVIVTAKAFDEVNNSATKMLEDFGCEVIRLKQDSEDMMDKLRREIVDADAVIPALEPYTEDLIASAPKLKVIARYGVGYDKVDVAAAHRHGVCVTITRGANAQSVADLAVGMMLNCARHISYMDSTIKAKDQQRPIGLELWEKTVGIIGTGTIGQLVAKRVSGFDTRILAYDVYKNEEFAKKYNVTYVDLDTLLKESDFITVHSPLNDDTRDMINTEQFKLMKKEAVLVNTARGGIVNEDALYEALKSGQIWAAGLDATVVEPPYASKLLELPNCTLTPHAGAATCESSLRVSKLAAEAVIEVLSTGKSQWEVQK